MSRPDAEALLRRALARSAAAAGTRVTIERSESTRWASATFVGARHELSAVLSDDAVAAGWLADLPDAELTLRGHLLADLKIVRATRDKRGMLVTLEALTVEDA